MSSRSSGWPADANRPPDLRTTIPLAAKTIFRRAKQPRRAWLVPVLTLACGLALATLLLELMFFPGPATALAFGGELRSRLIADYSADPAGSRIRELRLAIVDEVLGDGQSGGRSLPNAPVPTVTPEPTRLPTEPPAIPTPTGASSTEAALLKPPDSDSPDPFASTTPSATATGPPAAGLDCSKLRFEGIWFDGDDEIRARVQNDLPEDAFLAYTHFAWPDVPAPAYVDYFRFDDRYYHGNDHSSPTSRSSWERLRDGDHETWRVDFDDEPDEGLYGYFALTLKFEVPRLGGSCTISADLSKPIPPGLEPTEGPTETLLPPTATPLPPTATQTASPEPSDTPGPATPTETPDPTGEPTATESPAPSPTPTEA